MRVTNAKIDEILKSEINKRYYGKKDKLRDHCVEELERLAKERVPECITQELIDGGWVQVSNVINVVGLSLERWQRNEISLHLSNTYALRAKEWAHELVVTKVLKKRVEKYFLLVKEIVDYKEQLKSTLVAFRTKKSLLEAVPELKEYFEEKNCMALVPIEQVKKTRALLRYNQKLVAKNEK